MVDRVQLPPSVRQLERAARLWKRATKNQRIVLIYLGYGYECDAVAGLEWDAIGTQHKFALVTAMEQLGRLLEGD